MKKKLSEWADANFTENSRPSRATLMRWAQGGKIPGAVFRFGHWWVDDQAAGMESEIEHAVEQLPKRQQEAFR